MQQHVLADAGRGGIDTGGVPAGEKPVGLRGVRHDRHVRLSMPGEHLVVHGKHARPGVVRGQVEVGEAPSDLAGTEADEILLGDIEELWQFDLEKIVGRYGFSIYKQIRAFKPGRVHRVFGNHDIEWGSPPDPTANKPGKTHGAPEGLKLVDEAGTARILLVHGHQGTSESDKYAWISRFAVRAVTPFEWVGRLIGIKGARNPASPDSQVPTDFEAIRYLWAKRKRKLLICGHTHRAIFASESWGAELRRLIAEVQAKIQVATKKSDMEKLYAELRERNEQLQEEQDRGRDTEPLDSKPKPCYFNTGCGVYTSGPTCIEIADGNIGLVKWVKTYTRGGRRKPLREESITDYLKEL